jgi:acyl-CoA synthetase (NDP forming)/GNAT superfamily N-acetyltransferase
MLGHSRIMTLLAIQHDDVDALRSGGGIVHIRDLGPADLAEVRAVHRRASDRSIYLRFFSPNRTSAERYSAKLAEPPSRDHHALGAFVSGRMLAVAVFERIDEASAEFALLVADQGQRAGIGTLLLEHLAAAARGAGVERFVAEVLSENALMLETARNLGFVEMSSAEAESVHLELLLGPALRVIDAIGTRDEVAASASLRPLLSPTSVAVVGAGQGDRSVGHEILRNLLDAGFTGEVHVVNPNHIEVLGVPSVPSPLDLPIAPDLAIIAVPADRVANAIRACGQRGARAAVIVGAGFGEAGPEGVRLQNDVLGLAREYGMRLVGPNCIGIVNTDPAVRLDATFARLSRRPGPFAVLAQSGAFGVSLLTAADRLGLGVSQFVSVGNKADVGGNDLMLAWADDPRSRVIGMYLESIGDPRRFARIARRVSRSKPIIALKSGRTVAGRRGALSHTAAAASPEVTIDALFRSSGVLRVRTMEEMIDAARVLADQPLPAGPRIAIVGNSGGPEILAADAANDAGLMVVDFDDATRAELHRLGAPEQNPIDLGAAAQPELVADVLRALAASPSVDAVLTVFVDIAVTDTTWIREVVLGAAAATGKPIVAVEVGLPAQTVPIAGTTHSLPVFTFPEPAAAALGNAYRYTQLRGEPATGGRPTNTNPRAGRALVEAALAGRTCVAEGAAVAETAQGDAGEWLGAADIALLLTQYGIALCPQRVVHSADAAVAAAQELGYPVVLKLAAPGVHKTDLGGIRLNIADDAQLRTTAAELAELRPDSGGDLLVQPMITGGTELIVGAVRDAQFGTLVMLGAGGVLTEVLDDRAFRLAPLSADTADQMIGELRTASVLDGYRGAPVVSRAAIRNILVRIATMVDDLPQIAELDLNPLLCLGDQVLAVDARIRVTASPETPDPLVRQLRGPSVPR